MASQRNNRIARECLFIVFLLLTMTFSISPFLFMAKEAFSTPPVEGIAKISAQRWSFESFRQLFEIGDVSRFIINSLIHATGYTILSLLLNTAAAFAFARISFPGREKLFLLLIMAMMVPGQVIMIPVFLIVKTFGMLNSFAGLIIPGCAHAFGIFAIRQFMLDLPDEVFDAAKTDGCSDFDIFIHIAVPLCRPIIASMAVTSFIYTWDQFLYPLIIMQDEPMFTMPVALASMTSNLFGRWNVLLAGGFITALPCVIVFLLAQKAYVEGITSGSVKS